MYCNYSFIHKCGSPLFGGSFGEDEDVGTFYLDVAYSRAYATDVLGCRLMFL